MYTEASSGSRGNIATMKTPYMSRWIMSIQFWYHMYGLDIGRLNVKIMTSQRSSTLWSKSGNQGNMWSFACINVGLTVNQVIFEGIRGGSYRGDIAVDDILYSKSSCEEIDRTSCTFEDSMCGFRVIRGNRSSSSWNRMSGGDYRAPAYDHTTGKVNGKYVAMSYVSYTEGMKSYMVSQPLQVRGEQKLEFYYYIRGDMPGEIQASFRDVSMPMNEWAVHDWQDSGDHGYYWNYGCMDLHTESNRDDNTTKKRIQFTGITGYASEITLLLDDIKISNGSCGLGIEYETCTFQNPKMCNYKINCTAYNEYTWRRTTGSTSSLRTGPTSDSSKDKNGYYLYAESSYGYKGDAVSIMFPLKEAENKYLKFNYHMDGYGMGSLRVMYSKGNRMEETWGISGNQGKAWKFHCQKITTDIDAVSLLAVRGSSFTSDIAVDNVFVDPNPCPNPVNCDFENGMCNYTVSYDSSSFYWNMKTGSDHTYGNGHYLMTTSPYKSEGYLTNITTTAIVSSQNKSSLMFYYKGAKYDGRLMANFNRRSALTMTSDKYMKEFNPHYEDWVQACIDIPLDEIVSANVMTYSGMNRGNIMLDDFIYRESPCVYGILEEMCTFDEPNICGYNVSCRDATDFLWYRAQKSDSKSTGPNTDKTVRGKGFFAYAEASLGSPDDSTELEFPEFVAPAGHYVGFYYHMYGRDMGSLQVHIITDSGTELKWSEKGDQGNAWNKGCVNIPENKKVKVVFTAIRGNGPFGNMAIDDVGVMSGICYDRDINCDFTDPMMCGYKAGNIYNIGWNRVKTISGYAMSVKSSYGKYDLISPYKNVTDSCIQIDYKVSGGQYCMLDVFTAHNNKQQLNLKNNNETSVQKAQFYVKQAVTAIRFVANNYYNYYSTCTVQIDSVTVRNGACPALACQYNNTACMDQSQCVSNSSLCNRIKDCPDNSDEESCPKSISCDFEHPYLCGYNYSQGWYLTDMRKFSNQDLHLNNSVNSMTLNSGWGILSSPVETIPESCLQFAYAGGTDSSLEIMANYSSGNTASKWSANFSELTKWTVGQFNLSAGTVQLHFGGNASMLGLAIDNVKLHNGVCKNLAPDCPVDFFACGSNEKCIPSIGKCNRYDDCYDESDEKNCPTSITCDVEHPYQCGYQYKEGEWKVTNGQEDTFPDVDHSLGLYSGMYFQSIFGYSNKSEHILLAPKKTLVVDTCFSFHYSFIGNGQLEIYDNGIKKFSIKPTNLFAWPQAKLQLSKGTHQLSFKHVRGKRIRAVNDLLRLDSMKISNGTCKPLVCDEGWWKCTKSEMCIPNYYVCDREAHCFNSEDEDNCKNYTNIHLVGGRTPMQGLVEIYTNGISNANGIWNTTCGYWSQNNAEVVCRALGYNGTARTTFPTMPKYNYIITPIQSIRCNGSESSITQCSIAKCSSWCSCNVQAAVDCSNSHCLSNQVPCGYVNETLTPSANKTKCIFKENVCDSERDCPGDTDEQSCPKCKWNEFTCQNYECIPWEKQCDGVRNCKSGSDEYHCLQHSNYTMKFLKTGTYVPVCENNLKDQDIANRLCQYAGKGNASVGSSMSRGKGALFTYSAAADNSVFPGYTVSITTCDILTIKCLKTACGTRKPMLYDTMMQYSQEALPGSFPYQASLYRGSTFLCGAIIISRWYLLTAAHCIRGGYSASSFRVYIGSINVIGGRRYYISKMYAHANFSMSLLQNDIALLRVSSPIVMGDNVRPICLPSKPWVPHTQCFVSGWGRLENNRKSNLLHQAKVRLQTRYSCQKQYPNSDHTTICADNSQPHQIGCYGDSGGPLACRNEHGYLEVVGIFSYGRSSCTGPTYSSQVFADVYQLKKWVLDRMID